MRDTVLHARLMQATELTRRGQLTEATALIQRSLAAAPPPSRTPMATCATPDDVIEGECVVIGFSKPTGQAESGAESPKVRRPADGAKDLLRNLGRLGGAASPRARASTDTKAPGQFIAGSYANAAGERDYKLYIPSNHAGQALPLIVMLHGCTQSPDDFAAGTRMNRLAEEARCFVLYPAQAHSANHSRCWNWFRRKDQARDRGEPSIIAGMTYEIIRRRNINYRSVYIAGLSAGGAMAAVMAATYPDLYSGVGIHSGLACGSAHDLPTALAAMQGTQGSNRRPGVVAAHGTPTIVFHGDHDKTVHPRNGAEIIARSKHAGGPGESERGQSPNGYAYTRTVQRNAEGRVLLEHWLIHGGGHAWFGGCGEGSYTDAKGPDASAEMLRFFLQTACPRN